VVEVKLLNLDTYIDLEPYRITWIRSEKGTMIFEHEPGMRVLCGADAWAYHVWGAKAYSVCLVNGNVPLVLVEEPPSDMYKDTNDWITLAFNGKAMKPWMPISLYVKGVDKPVRKGTLVAVP